MTLRPSHFVLLSLVAALGAPGCSLTTHFGSFSGGDGSGMDAGDLDAPGTDVPRMDAFDSGRDAPIRDGDDVPPPPDVPTDVGVTFRLTVNTTGPGDGTITSDMGGIACGATCTDLYLPGTVVTLTIAPDSVSQFTGWSGDCTGTMPTCMVTMDGDRTVTAELALVDYTVTVVRSGDGSGSVAGGGITCGSTCSVTVPARTMMSLTATPTTGSTFGGWGGPCTGTGTCDFEVLGDEIVTAAFDEDRRSLSVTTSGTGTGTVDSTPAGIDCGTDCSESYLVGTMVTLNPNTAANSRFAGWSGDCTGTGACVVTMSAARTVGADFELLRHTLTVQRSGTGSGDVFSLLPDVTAIDCGTTSCSTTQDHGTLVRLQAFPSAGSNFLGWSGGGCSGTGLCTVTLTAATTVTANFQLIDRTLSVTTTGSGSVSSAPAGIDCPGTCSDTFGHGTVVTLTASPGLGQELQMWTGDCSGMASSCMVTMDASRTVGAVFRPQRFTLTTSTTGAGSGTITGSGIDCGADCTEQFDYGTNVTLTATPMAGSTFAGWGGDCSGAGSCVVSITAAANVTATFVLGSSLVRVVKAGTGDGTVTSAPAGINCGASCAAGYTVSTMVTLTASPVVGSTFAGWSGGGCSGTGTCVVTVGAAETEVTATFNAIPRTLTVSRSGLGTVLSTPIGINCGSDCSEVYPHGTVVQLDATADASTTFTGWSGGGCSGTGSCMVTLTADTTVTATFVTNNYTVDVSRGGAGSGTITGPGINCGADCSETYPHGTMLTLTATAAAGSTFVRWTGIPGCSGSPVCTTTVTGPIAATALFDQITHVLTVMKTGGGGGTVQASDGSINCGAVCSASYTEGSTVTLSATPVTGSSIFTGWTDPTCAPFGTGDCVVPMNAAYTAVADFVPLRTVTIVVAGASGVHQVDVFQDASFLGTCGVGTCAYTVPNNATVLVRRDLASAPVYWPFQNWGGACMGVPPDMDCTRTITANTTINATYRVANLAFVTGAMFGGRFGATAASARTAANQACNDEAMMAGLPGVGSYVAWLTNSTSSALSGLGTSTIWVRPDGALFSNNGVADRISTGAIVHPLAIDATGADLRSFGTVFATPAELRVWTGTNVDGALGTGGDATSNCANWTSNAIGTFGTTGSLERTVGGWTAHEQNVPCSEAAHLYCFSTGLTLATTTPISPVPPRSASGDTRAVIFLAPPLDGGRTVANMDAACQSAAVASGLPTGTYVAFVGTPGNPAINRIGAGFVGPWFRPDGFAVGDYATISGSRALGATPSLTAASARLGHMPSWRPTVSEHELWTGMPMAGGATGSPGMTQSCNGWTSTGGSGQPFGDPSSSLPTTGMGWQSDVGSMFVSGECAQMHAYYCIRSM